jgi:hypothetical protein
MTCVAKPIAGVLARLLRSVVVIRSGRRSVTGKAEEHPLLGRMHFVLESARRHGLIFRFAGRN